MDGCERVVGCGVGGCVTWCVYVRGTAAEFVYVYGLGRWVWVVARLRYLGRRQAFAISGVLAAGLRYLLGLGT